MESVGRKQLPHEAPISIDTANAAYFITICAQHRDRKPLLEGDRPEALLRSIQHYHKLRRWWIHVAVIMPDHVHLLATIPERMPAVVRSWRRWAKAKSGILWQADFFDHRLRSEESLREKADYILMNPVRAGLVARMEEWPYRWIGS